MTHSTRRGIGWWIVSITAPIGIFAGPIGIASMLQGLIEWRGMFAYAVHFWSEAVSPPFIAVTGWLASRIGLSPPPVLAVDYLIIGALTASSYLRARAIVAPVAPKPFFARIANALAYVIAWPITVASVVVSVAREGVRSWTALGSHLRPVCAVPGPLGAERCGRLTGFPSSSTRAPLPPCGPSHGNRRNRCVTSTANRVSKDALRIERAIPAGQIEGRPPPIHPTARRAGAVEARI